MKFKYALTIVYLVAVFTLNIAYAQDNWLVGNGNWSNAANWSLGLPGPSSDAEINSGFYNYAVTLDLSPNVNSLIVGGNSAQLTDAGVARNLSIANTLTINFSGGVLLHGAGSTVSVGGALYDYGSVFLYGPGELADAGQVYLSYASNLYIGPSATLNLTNQPGGINDIPYRSGLQVYGSFNDVVGGGSGLANLTSVEGSLLILNGQTTTINPIGGTLSVIGGCGFGGCFEFGNGSTVNILGNMISEGALITGISGAGGNILNITGNLYSFGDTRVGGLGDLVNVGTTSVYGNFYIESNAVVNVAGDLNNFGSFQIWNASRTNITGTLNNNGSFLMEYNAGETVTAAALSNGLVLRVGEGDTLNVGTFTQLGADNPLTVVDGLLSSATGLRINAGSLSGRGIIQGDVFMGGTLITGLDYESGLFAYSPAKLGIQGNYTQLSGGTFTEEIAGVSPDTLYDQLIVDGAVSLDGTLTVSLLNGYIPAVDSTYKFLFFTPGDLTGTFATVPVYWHVIYDNADGYVELESVPEPSGFLLLGSGLLGALGAFRSKIKL